jgi:NAD(P)-dependent dehydrogenase (short-subunit alcohol dehydrogenase family)
VKQLRLDGRVAIVTGAGQGLGRAHALALADRGAAVVVNDVGGDVNGHGMSDAASAVVGEIKARGGIAAPNHDSVASRVGAQAMVDQAIGEFGSIDIVVANAGIKRDGAYEDYDEQDMHEMLDVHLKGSFWVTQAAYRVMKERSYGRVVFTTSGSGLFGRANSPGYVAAKGGILGLMNSLAIEGAPYNVRANAVGPIALTRMTANLALGPDAAERGRPELVSNVVVYLSSESCSINHEVIEAGFGTYTRIFVGRTYGWAGDALSPLSPEDVAEHLNEIRDTRRFIMPMSSKEDIADLLERLPS